MCEILQLSATNILKEINGVDYGNWGIKSPPSPLHTLENEMLEILEELYVERGQEPVEEVAVPATEVGVIVTSFRPKSSFYPYWNKGNSIPTFYEVVMEEFRSICSMKRSKWTKCHEVDIAGPLCSLKRNSEVIIRKADKGRGLVIEDREQYLEEACRLIGVTDTYEKLSWDPTSIYNGELKRLLDKALLNQVLTKNEYQNIWWCPTFTIFQRCISIYHVSMYMP